MDWSRNVDDDPFEEADVEIPCNQDTKCWKPPLQYRPLHAKALKPSVFVPRYDSQPKSIPSPKDITVVSSPISAKRLLPAKTTVIKSDVPPKFIPTPKGTTVAVSPMSPKPILPVKAAVIKSDISPRFIPTPKGTIVSVSPMSPKQTLPANAAVIKSDISQRFIPTPKGTTVTASLKPTLPAKTSPAKTGPTMASDQSNQTYTQTNDSRNQQVYQPPTLSSIPDSVRQTLTVQPYEKEIRKPVSESEIISMSVVESPVDSKTAQDCFMNYLKDLEGKIINLNKEKGELQLKLEQVNKALEGAENGKCGAVAKLAVNDEGNLQKAEQFLRNQGNYFNAVVESTKFQQGQLDDLFRSFKQYGTGVSPKAPKPASGPQIEEEETVGNVPSSSGPPIQSAPLALPAPSSNALPSSGTPLSIKSPFKPPAQPGPLALPAPSPTALVPYTSPNPTLQTQGALPAPSPTALVPYTSPNPNAPSQGGKYAQWQPSMRRPMYSAPPTYYRYGPRPPIPNRGMMPPPPQPRMVQHRHGGAVTQEAVRVSTLVYPRGSSVASLFPSGFSK
jgi:hypothetical protein